jgi:two-component system chemotaxis response regulator CheB
MASTKVLVVDDSLTMRALISGALERIPNVEVVGMADGAAEAREMVARLKPHVMTLDVEMPGMSGIEYLAEIMAENPMPVIMFSTRTTEGAAESIEALRLGAVDCFPKPRVAVPAELDVIIAKLGKRIKSATAAEMRPARKPSAAAAAAATRQPIDWNGRLVVMGADASATAALFDILTAFPENCPPTLVVQHLGPGLVETMAAQLDAAVAPKVVVATNGMAIEQGHIYFAPQGEQHLAVDAWPAGKLRLLARDPVAGERPSATLLFAAAARAAGAAAVGVLLATGSEDGAVGLKALLAASGHAFMPATSGGGYTLASAMAQQPTARDALPAAILKMCSK